MQYINKSNANSMTLKDLKEAAKAKETFKSEIEDCLICDERGKIQNVPANYITFFEKAPQFKEKLRYNEFAETIFFGDKAIDDNIRNDAYMSVWEQLGFHSHQAVDDALLKTSRLHSYHPLKDYFTSLEWDGKERIKDFFKITLDAEDTKLNETMTFIWFVATVKRIFEPGCQFDNMIVLQGLQGIGKTQVVRRLLQKGYVNELKDELNNNTNLIHKLNISAIVYIDELDSFTKAEMSTIKSFISGESDSGRLSYAHDAKNYPRHCTFIGSTNDNTFLKDNTSKVERRFWVIKCLKETRDDRFVKIMTKEYVDQLWAEAYDFYMHNPDYYLDIPTDLQNEFANTMDQFKNYHNDDALELIFSLLNDRTYILNGNGDFKNQDDFLNQARQDEKCIISPETTLLTDFENEMTSQYLDHIPGGWLKYVIEKLYGKDYCRSIEYIANASENVWEARVKYVKGRSVRMLIKKA